MSRATPEGFARALGGDIVGAQVLCPGPGHSPKDRSLSVQILSGAPEDFLVHSFAGDDPLACRDHVRSQMGWARPARFGRDDKMPVVPRVSQQPLEDAVKIGRAQAIWNEAIDPRGTVVEFYLNSRSLDLPALVANEALRFHPNCPWRDDETGQRLRVPAMVAAMRSMQDEKITGIHRTRLTLDGKKVGRKMLGKASGAAIMLAPWSSLGGGLAVAEGIETALAGWQLGWSNIWAMGSVSAIANLPLLRIDALTIMAETGDNGASERAVIAVGQRWYEAGREVIIVEPAFGGDLNDALRGVA